MKEEKAVINFNPWQFTKILSIIALTLAGANVFFNAIKFLTGDKSFYGLIPLFQLSGEGNIPAFFSGILFLICAALLIVVWHLRRENNKRKLIWLFLAALFTFLSFDELFSVHELLIDPLRSTLGAGGFFYFAWIIGYGAAVLVLALIFFPTWWRLPRNTKIWFAVSAVVYMIGVIGFEMIGGAIYETSQGGVIYGAAYTIEETLEMAGLIIFIWSLLNLLYQEFGSVSIIVSNGKPSTPAVSGD